MVFSPTIATLFSVVALAHYWYQAEDYDHAFTYFLQAAQQAQSRYAQPEALALYQQAAALSLLRAHDSASDILALTGNYIGARNNYERQLRLLEEHPSDAAMLRSTIQRKIGSTYEHQGNLEQALMWFTLATDMLPAEDSAETAQVHAAVISDIGWIHFRAGELDEAQRYLEQARDRIEHVPAYDEQARIHNRLGGVAWSRGDLALARQYVEQSLAACARSDDLVGQAHALNSLGLISETQGFSETAIDYGLQAMELYEQVGNVRMLAIATYNIGGLLYDRADYQQAHSYFTEALEHALTVRDTLHQTRALRHLGATLAALEQIEAAERALQQSQFIAAQLHLPIEQLEGHIAVAELALKRGAIEPAKQEYEQASLLAVEEQSEEYGRLQRLAARIATAQGEHASAIAILKANATLFAQLQNAPEAEKPRKLLTSLLEQPQF